MPSTRMNYEYGRQLLNNATVLVLLVFFAYCFNFFALSEATTTTSSSLNIDNNRDWPKLGGNRYQTNQYQSNSGSVWFNSGSNTNTTSTTTPWPALGGKRDYVNPNNNNNNKFTNQPTWSRPIGVSSSNTRQSTTGIPNNQGNRRYVVNNNGNNRNRDYVNPHFGKQQSTTAQPSTGGMFHNNNNNSPNNNNNANPNRNTPPKNAGNSAGGMLTTITNTGDNQEDNELRELSETLLKKDVNNAAKFLTVNYQGRTNSRSPVDEAPLPLLTIQPEVYNISTIAKLVPLFNNYILETTQNEHVTAQERTEENTLLDALIPTSIMQHVRNYLVDKNKIGRDPREFRDLLRLIWFNMYARGGGRIGSSGFEHVFLAEIKNQQVSGLHNWIYFNQQELQKNADYLGYMKKLDLGNKGAILKYHFTFSNIDKPVGAMFIGTSPEFEMALYTVCFVMRADAVCPLRLNDQNFVIRTYKYRYRGKDMIGSAFPEI